MVVDEINRELIPLPEPCEVGPSPPIPNLIRRLRGGRYILPVLLAATALICAALLLCTHYTLCLNVKIDGQVVGRLADEGELGRIVAVAEENISAILGYDYAVDDRVSHSLGIIPAKTAGELDGTVVEKAIYEEIAEIDMHYVITVDGEEIGYISQLSDLRLAMDDYLSGLKTGDTLSAEFLSQVEFELKYVDVGEELDASAIETLVEGLSVEKVERIVYTEPIPHEKEVLYDEDRYIEDSQVIREGADGEAEVIAEVTYIDGQEEQLTVLHTSVVTDQISELYVEGLLERPLTASYGEYIWPVAGTVSSYFGPRSVAIGSSNHQGLDIACPANEYVYAADGGEVIFAGWSGGYGNLVQIRHDNGHVTYYAHNNSLDVSVGDLVYQGQLIARAGMTGTASGNHVHFEIRIDGVAVDPLGYLP